MEPAEKTRSSFWAVGGWGGGWGGVGGVCEALYHFSGITVTAACGDGYTLDAAGLSGYTLRG